MRPSSITDDAIGHAHRGEAVADQDGDPPGGQLAEALEDLVLGLGVEGRGRLVEHEHLASRMKARASAIFCHWPPESSAPFSNQRPSMVS